MIQQLKQSLSLRENFTIIKIKPLLEPSAIAKEDSTVATLCFDFQQNLPVPVLPVGEIFYARKLWFYNFGIHNAANNKGTMHCCDQFCLSVA